LVAVEEAHHPYLLVLLDLVVQDCLLVVLA
jgi:hypothetical protein